MFARYGAVSIFLTLILFCMPAAADDAPYAPQESSIDDLIKVEVFDASPIAFPWERVSAQRTTSDGSRMDFELIYDVNYGTVYDELSTAYSEADDLITLEPEALQYTSIDGLRLMGHQLDTDGGRITVGHPDVNPSFIVDIEPDGQRTRIVVQNLLRTTHYSGFVPARVDFQPIGADAIPFRWN